MKKLILLLAGVAMVSGSFAQSYYVDRYRNVWTWGLKGGLNLATITDTDDNKMKPGIYVGAFAEYRINQYIGIQPEVVYSRQGAKFESGDMDTWYRVNYLNIPILAKIYVFERLSVDVGPQFGFRLNAKDKTEVGNVESKTNVTDDTKGFDISVPVGLSYQITDYLDASVRYNIGLTKVNENGDNKSKNGVLQIGVGVRF